VQVDPVQLVLDIALRPPDLADVVKISADRSSSELAPTASPRPGQVGHVHGVLIGAGGFRKEPLQKRLVEVGKASSVTVDPTVPPGLSTGSSAAPGPPTTPRQKAHPLCAVTGCPPGLCSAARFHSSGQWVARIMAAQSVRCSVSKTACTTPISRHGSKRCAPGGFGRKHDGRQTDHQKTREQVIRLAHEGRRQQHADQEGSDRGHPALVQAMTSSGNTARGSASAGRLVKSRSPLGSGRAESAAPAATVGTRRRL